MIVGKDLSAPRREAERRRLAEARSQIAYTPLFGQLFLEAIRVIYGDQHPKQALAHLDRLPASMEVDLYRTLIEGLWEQDPDRYGPAPA